MHNYCIITNNPLVHKEHPSVSRYLDGNVDDVLIMVRDAIHQGAMLISHPLAGSIKPYQSPYRSVLVSCTHGDTDMRSLAIIEDALSTYRAFSRKAQTDSDSLLFDYQVIENDLVQSALASLPAQYYSH